MLHQFINSDGRDPYAGLIFDGAGNLYVTSVAGSPNGGAVSNCRLIGMEVGSTYCSTSSRAGPLRIRILVASFWAALALFTVRHCTAAAAAGVWSTRSRRKPLGFSGCSGCEHRMAGSSMVASFLAALELSTVHQPRLIAN